MEIKSFRSLNLFNFLFLLMMFSCSKSVDNIETGSLTGSVKLYDRYGQESFNYNDIKIKLTDANKKSVSVNPGSDGKFKIDSLVMGEDLLVIDKPGYGGIDSIKVNHTMSIDTLSQIILFEEVPFFYNTFSLDYVNGQLKWENSTAYNTTETYMVTDIFCFSKHPDVSKDVSELLGGSGIYVSANGINSAISSATSYSVNNFLNNGFNYGDRIYVVNYPVPEKWGTIYVNQKKYFNIFSFKMNNPSVICSFILRQK